MNKAFVREPDFDGRVYCPECGSLGVPVTRETLDHHVQKQSRPHLGDTAWFCDYVQCDAGYFDQFERVVAVGELQSTVYPKDPDAPICACFGFTLDDIEDDVQAGTPTQIRELLGKSQSPDANCQMLAADGRCCMREVQRLYTRRAAELRE
ncbi:MAG: hypothetical protein ABGZ23_17325 [Fuerstiella sp.]|nr:hypothetical protein [Fuerstiella sp.]